MPNCRGAGLRIGIIGLAAMIAPTAGAQSAPVEFLRSLVGTWRLAAFEARESGGAVSSPLGPRPRGQLRYDADGQMSVHLMNPDRPPFASGDRARGTADEIRAAFIGYLAYYGRFTVDTVRGTITHHVEGASFPNWVGTDLVRSYRLERDPAGTLRLTLTTPPMSVAGRQLVSTLVWERSP